MEERISGPTAGVNDRHSVGTQQEAIVRSNLEYWMSHKGLRKGPPRWRSGCPAFHPFLVEGPRDVTSAFEKRARATE